MFVIVDKISGGLFAIKVLDISGIETLSGKEEGTTCIHLLGGQMIYTNKSMEDILYAIDTLTECDESPEDDKLVLTNLGYMAQWEAELMGNPAAKLYANRKIIKKKRKEVPNVDSKR